METIRVTRRGPYEIDRRLFERAIRQINLLEGRVPGRTVLYKAIDLGYREGAEATVLNCIHAVSDVVREPAPLRTWATYGDEAARRVMLHLRPWIKSPTVEEPRIWEAIWMAIRGGAGAPPTDAIARADLGPADAKEALAGGRPIGGRGILGPIPARPAALGDGTGRIADETATAGGG